MKHILSIVGYVLGTFLTQGASHFAIFKEHYSRLSYLRPEPIFVFGISSMVIQGLILSFAYSRAPTFYRKSMMRSVQFAWLFGGFLLSYIAFGEAGKYLVPHEQSWIAVEVLVGAIQFTIIGILMHLAHRRS